MAHRRGGGLWKLGVASSGPTAFGVFVPAGTTTLLSDVAMILDLADDQGAGTWVAKPLEYGIALSMQ